MIVIIGAGISGLMLAYELQKQGIPYQLFEAAGEPGGVIRSRRETTPDGASYLRELGPNSLLVDQNLLNDIDALGLTPDLRFSKPVSKSRYIFRNGAYRKLPSGPLSLLFGPSFFSWETLKAIWKERNNRTVSPPDETLSQFFRRRFSQEIVDYALTPFVTGIYAGDPSRLLVSETFPSLLKHERDYGSVLRGFMKTAGGERKQMVSFKEGMQMLPKAIADQLTALKLNDPVTGLIRTENGWLVDASSGSFQADAVVLAADTSAAAKLLELTYPGAAEAFRRLDYPPMTAVHSVYKRADVAHPLNGFGGLNPRIENQFCAGHIWNSSIFDDRCPADEVLLTTFVGGRLAAANTELLDEAILEKVFAEHKQAFGIKALKPVHQWLARWERAIPQYDLAYAEAKRHLPALEADGLFVCANWHGGISLPDNIRKGKELAKRLGQWQLA
ncbi:protoporphyrinogen oxidase [Tellurirhabdus bombi]|uniref:protoporphyrinogen oxidase n=1 Tax=Tellurirhabdus bombi TaxID=2907205 RepID=UPI00286D8B42|nr:protoporphyrinogen oxidase [Tellurirhabdus bombi]